MTDLLNEIIKPRPGSLYRPRKSASVYSVVNNEIRFTDIESLIVNNNDIILIKDPNKICSKSMKVYLDFWTKLFKTTTELKLIYGLVLNTNQNFVNIHLTKIIENCFEKLSE
jgi:hypothetical protein